MPREIEMTHVKSVAAAVCRRYAQGLIRKPEESSCGSSMSILPFQDYRTFEMVSIIS